MKTFLEADAKIVLPSPSSLIEAGELAKEYAEKWDAFASWVKEKGGHVVAIDPKMVRREVEPQPQPAAT